MDKQENDKLEVFFVVFFVAYSFLALFASILSGIALGIGLLSISCIAMSIVSMTISIKYAKTYWKKQKQKQVLEQNICPLCKTKLKGVYCHKCGTYVGKQNMNSDEIKFKKSSFEPSEDDILQDFKEEEMNKEYSDTDEDIENARNAMKNILLEEYECEDKFFSE